jgi:penicillin-binding protein A
LTENRHLRVRRARPVLAVAAIAFVAGALIGAGKAPSASVQLAKRFVAQWAHGQYATMYAEITPGEQHEISLASFAGLYREALATATATTLARQGRARASSGGQVSMAVRVQTRLWGRLTLPFTLATVSVEGDTRVRWSRAMVFPDLPAGEALTRQTTLPRRATLLARDGSVLAESPPEGEPGRSTPLGEYGTAVVGEVGPIPASRRAELEAEGVPADAQVGVSGLELALDGRLRGRPGGELLAGARVLASVPARAAPPVKTSVSPSIQRAAVTALGGQLGGVVAMIPSTGEILAVAGLGLDGLQPPGSTFKIVTVSGVLAAHLATPSTVFPYATHATLDGVRLGNANGEECGGSLELAFAVSCNSVFTPLGVRLGAQRLVATAEAFGFNHEPGLAGASESTLPAASQIQGELDVGSTAIGQGEVLATPLQMLTVAATIADEGRRPVPTFVPGAGHTGTQAISGTIARTVRHLMTEVVREGTGTAAAIPGVVVAGKTGTAELQSECTSASTEGAQHEGEKSEQRDGEGGCKGAVNEASNTDAWFTSFAPAVHPRIAVCVMLVKDGAGGATAAPVAREVLEAGLQGGI